MIAGRSFQTVAFRAALTLACAVTAAVARPSDYEASAQTARVCTNTGCSGVDRCVYWGTVNCSMTRDSCTNRNC